MATSLHVANLSVRDIRSGTANKFPALLGPSERCKQRQMIFELKQAPGTRDILFTLDATRITLAPLFLGEVCVYSLNTLLPSINSTTAQILSHMAAAPPPRMNSLLPFLLPSSLVCSQ
jgi:hypothetical protein